MSVVGSGVLWSCGTFFAVICSGAVELSAVEFNVVEFSAVELKVQWYAVELWNFCAVELSAVEHCCVMCSGAVELSDDM